MRSPLRFTLTIIFGLTSFQTTGYAADDVNTVRKAVERSTLKQAGTKPFHLKATVAPSLERNRGSNRTGEIEIWWVSPTEWKREVHSPEFHQIEIVNGEKEWQKNEGDYFPEWLREVSVALIEPVPYLTHVLQKVQDADVKGLMGTTHFSWAEMSTDGTVEKGMGAGIDIDGKTGLLLGGSGLGWSGYYSDYKGFHNRMVARTLHVGTPEVTAKVVMLEDLGSVPPGFFDAPAIGGNSGLVHTALVEELEMRKSLINSMPNEWPPQKDGPLKGAMTTEIVVDRAGKVREIGSILSDNPGLSESFGKATAALQFKPCLQNGIAVQVVSRITTEFKTTRPAGIESFDSARDYFERGGLTCFPAAGNGQPYVLHAVFQVRVKAGSVEEGRYIDSWKSKQEWRREATIGKSKYVRSQHGDTRYELAEGPDSGALRLVLKTIEPIPALDTFIESDWRMRRDIVNGVKTVRVLAGYEAEDGKLDPEHSRAFWFDENGKLVKSYFRGLYVDPANFEKFDTVSVARQIGVIRDGALGMAIRITTVEAAKDIDERSFVVKGHEWKRAFTDETR